MQSHNHNHRIQTVFFSWTCTTSNSLERESQWNEQLKKVAKEKRLGLNRILSHYRANTALVRAMIWEPVKYESIIHSLRTKWMYDRGGHREYAWRRLEIHLIGSWSFLQQSLNKTVWDIFLLILSDNCKVSSLPEELEDVFPDHGTPGNKRPKDKVIGNFMWHAKYP